MMKKTKSTKTKKKRGPREERLIISTDPKDALDKLLKKPPSK
jgi:hypothetical protein